MTNSPSPTQLTSLNTLHLATLAASAALTTATTSGKASQLAAQRAWEAARDVESNYRTAIYSGVSAPGVIDEGRGNSGSYAPSGAQLAQLSALHSATLAASAALT